MRGGGLLLRAHTPACALQRREHAQPLQAHTSCRNFLQASLSLALLCQQKEMLSGRQAGRDANSRQSPGEREGWGVSLLAPLPWQRQTPSRGAGTRPDPG